MKSAVPSRRNTPPSAQNVTIIRALFVLAIAITVSGAAFAIYSLLMGTSFRVLNASLPGALFGVMVIYFGIRSILSVRRLREEVYKKGAKFSWNNFKKRRSSK